MGVHLALMDDWMMNLEKALPAVLEAGVTVLVYVGVDDFICNVAGQDAWIKTLKYAGHDEFNEMQMQPWRIDGKIVGEAKSSKGLTYVKVHDAGHMVPMDQPAVALAMLNDCTSGQI